MLSTPELASRHTSPAASGTPTNLGSWTRRASGRRSRVPTRSRRARGGCARWPRCSRPRRSSP
uniref:Uncharacterized protein n=1 Tax=Arundo donax TaxID=35708 RepID=A0A0A9GVH6_ARUDO